MARRTARRNGTVETEPQCRLIAGKRQLDDLGRQFRGARHRAISAARVGRLEEPRAVLQDGGPGPWRTAGAGPALPVPPVLSRRDQAPLHLVRSPGAAISPS